MRKIQLKSDKLNIGCGTDVRKGFVNLDYFKFKGVDIVHDINKFPWPFEDNSFSQVIMYHVLEHVEDPVAVVDEIWRITKKNAHIEIRVPHYSGLNAVEDPTHKNFFAAKTFNFFERGRLGKGNYFEESEKMNFKIVHKEIVYSDHRFLRIFNSLVNLNQDIYERFFAYIFPSQGLHIEMRTIK